MPATVIVTRNGRDGQVSIKARHGDTHSESIYNMVARATSADSTTTSTTDSASSSASSSAATSPSTKRSGTRPKHTGELYQSVYAAQARKEYKKHQQRVGVIGPAEVKKELPTQFLKKQSKHQAQPVAVVHSQDAVKHATKQQKQRLALWEYNKQPAIPLSPAARPKSGPRPAMVYREKQDYGQVPAYLHSRKQELNQKQTIDRLRQQDQQQQQQHNDQHVAGGKQAVQRGRAADFTPLSEEERVRVVEGLRAKWSVLMKEYQHMSLIIDTVPKIHKKVALDKELNKIEQDIEKFSHPNIFIKQ